MKYSADLAINVPNDSSHATSQCENCTTECIKMEDREKTVDDKYVEGQKRLNLLILNSIPIILLP
jgi:hypothetical protein